MTLRRLLLALLCCCSAACAKLAPGGGQLNDPCVRTSDCLDPFVCSNGHCLLDAARVCSPDQLRCNGDDVEICDKGGDAFKLQEHCDRGCVGGACRAQVCNPGEQRCTADTIEECLPNGGGFVTRQTCPTTCQTDPTDMTKAECSTPVCTPFETKCNDNNPAVLETCNSNGTAFVDTACSDDPANKPAACVVGHCLPIVCSVSHDSMGNVTGREQRCHGVVAEQCNDTGTAFEALQVCSNGCNFDEMTGKATCPDAVCAPFSTTCKDNVTLETCNAAGTAYTTSMCTAPGGGDARCVNGGCFPKVCSVVKDSHGSITGRDEQCSGNVRQRCNDTETGWQAVEYCQYGCSPSGKLTQCAQPACQVGETRCDGLALEACTPDQSGFGFVQYCASGCVADTTTTPPSAACALPTCAPLSRKCDMDSSGVSSVMLCRADGTQFDQVETCTQGCVGGVCIVNDASCNPGDLRCQGNESQLCVRLSNGATEWRFNEHCFDACSSGACTTTNACGCIGGPDASTTCGPTGTKSPITVTAVLPSAAGTTVPCQDGVATSRVLVYTSVITNEAGRVVPDGTMITFTNDYPAGSPDNIIASADADPSTPGIQRPTLNGQAEVLVSAPACTDTRTVTITASAGGTCAGTTTIPFAPAPTNTTLPTRTVFVAEDFSSDRYNDRSATTAQWDIGRGAAVGNPDFSLGTGTDLDLTVNSGTLDLQASGWATAWNVTGLTSQSAFLDTSVPLTLVAGDEVLLITIWGPSGSTGPGNYEFKRIASVTGNGVSFTQSVFNTYGNNTNADLSGHRVVLQRVPQFRNVTVAQNSTLTSSGPTKGSCTSNCFPTGGTGVLAFRATGTVQIRGAISMDGRGLPPGLSSYPNLAATASLNRLLLGNQGTGAGGGVVFFTGATVSFAVDPTAATLDFSNSSSATIHSSAATADASAGTVWVEGGTLQFGTTTRLLAASGASGRTRLDYGSLDNTTNPMSATGTTFVGQAGAFLLQTLSDYLEPTVASGSLDIHTAQFLGALGGAGTTAFGAPGSAQVIPGINIFVSADGGASWGDIDSGNVVFDTSTTTPGTAKFGRDFRYKATLATPNDKPLFLRGVAFVVTAHQ